MNVTFSNIKRDEQETQIGGETVESRIIKSILEVINKKNFILGDSVEKFEKAFADYCGTRYCISVGSGLAALHLSLIGLGIKEGDEVITVANTFNATAAAILKSGAKPVLVDASCSDFNINTDEIEKKICEKTKAIIPVHLYGQTADMLKIMYIAKKYNLHVIEDACQAHGAKFWGIKAGSFGVSGCFSFYPGKNLGAYGDGGAVVTDNPELADFLKKARNYGQSKKYFHDAWPDNSRLDTIQAAALIEKLNVLDKWNSMRREKAEIYRQQLKNVVDIELPSERKEGEHVYHLFVIKTKKRDELQNYLESNGIQTGKHYPVPIHLQPCFSKLGYKQGDFPVSEKLSDEILSLPIFPTMKEEELSYVCEKIREFYSR